MTPAIINAAMYLAFCVFCVALPMAAGRYFLRRSERKASRASITSHLGPDGSADPLYPKVGTDRRAVLPMSASASSVQSVVDSPHVAPGRLWPQLGDGKDS